MTTIARYTKKLVRYLRNTRAVSALEYALLTGIIAVAISAAFQTFSATLKSAMEGMAAKVAGGATTGGSTTGSTTGGSTTGSTTGGSTTGSTTGGSTTGGTT